MLKQLSYRITMSSMQAKYIGKLNRLNTLQQQVTFWEQSTEHYKKALTVFQDYIDCLGEFGDSKAIVNGYIRMAEFCEKMEDNLLSRELLKDAKQMMLQFNLGNSVHLEKMQKKIDALGYYY